MSACGAINILFTLGAIAVVRKGFEEIDRMIAEDSDPVKKDGVTEVTTTTEVKIVN